jgi:hypothetical protein
MNTKPDSQPTHFETHAQANSRKRKPKSRQRQKNLSTRGPGGVYPSLATLIRQEEANSPRRTWSENEHAAITGLETINVPPNLLWKVYRTILKFTRVKKDPETVEYLRWKYVDQMWLIDLLLELESPGSVQPPANPMALKLVRQACELYLRGPYWDSVELEARLLTNQDNQGIATAMKLPLGTVQAYELLFFNVLKYLTYRSTINVHVLGIHDEDTNQVIGCWLRKNAFDGGLHVLEAALKTIRMIAYPDSIKVEEAKSNHEKWQELQNQRLFIIDLVTFLVPETDKNRLLWLRIYCLIQRLELLEEQNGATAEQNPTTEQFESPDDELVDQISTHASAYDAQTPGA